MDRQPLGQHRVAEVPVPAEVVAVAMDQHHAGPGAIGHVALLPEPCPVRGSGMSFLVVVHGEEARGSMPWKTDYRSATGAVTAFSFRSTGCIRCRASGSSEPRMTSSARR